MMKLATSYNARVMYGPAQACNCTIVHRNGYASERLCIGYASETTSEYKGGKEHWKREKWRRTGKDKEGEGGEKRQKIGEPMGRDWNAREGKEGKVAWAERSRRKRMSI
jgi:hypothetical protein